MSLLMHKELLQISKGCYGSRKKMQARANIYASNNIMVCCAGKHISHYSSSSSASPLEVSQHIYKGAMPQPDVCHNANLQQQQQQQ
jgi:hypothetical protein